MAFVVESLSKEELEILSRASDILALINPGTSAAIVDIINQYKKTPIVNRLGHPDFDAFVNDAVSTLSEQDIKTFEHYVFMIGFMQSQNRYSEVLAPKPADVEAWKQVFSEDGMVHFDVDAGVYSALIDKLKQAKSLDHPTDFVAVKVESGKRKEREEKSVKKTKPAKTDPIFRRTDYDSE